MTRISPRTDDEARRRLRERVFARHGTLRRLSDEVEGLICSEDMESAVASGANKAGISSKRTLTPSAIKKTRPKLRGEAAEVIIREMRDQRHAGRLPRH
jgi:hypothetical protein